MSKASEAAGLPPEVMKFAKKMGIDLSGLEPEAQDIWVMLENMSRNDPLQYDEFVRQQFEEAKLHDNSDTVKEPIKRSFRPNVGFCVAVRTFGGDGLKIREVNDSRSGSMLGGKTLYVNICSSPAVEQPTDKAGQVVSPDRFSADGLSVPLVVGPPRDVEQGTALAVDVVFGGLVLQIAAGQPAFKKQIADLALDWVLRESDLRFDPAAHESDPAAYKGGRGAGGNAPVLFFVEEEESERGGASSQAKKKSDPLQSPAALSSFLTAQETAGGGCAASGAEAVLSRAVQQPGTSAAQKQQREILLPAGLSVAGSGPGATKPKGSLVQEMGADGKPVVSSQEQRPLTESSQVAESPAALERVALQTSTPPPPPPAVEEWQRMERLMERLDDDFVSASAARQLQAADQSRQVLLDLSIMLTGVAPPGDPVPPSDARLSPVEQSFQERFTTSVAFPRGAVSQLTTSCDSAGLRRQLVLQVDGLAANLLSARIDLQVSPQKVVIRIPSEYFVGGAPEEAFSTVEATAINEGFLLQQFDNKQVAASFKKKSGTLTVKIALN